MARYGWARVLARIVPEKRRCKNLRFNHVAQFDLDGRPVKVGTNDLIS